LLFASLVTTLTIETLIKCTGVAIYATTHTLVMIVLSLAIVHLLSRHFPGITLRLGGIEMLRAASVCISFPNSSSMAMAIISVIFTGKELSEAISFTSLVLAIVQSLLFSIGRIMLVGGVSTVRRTKVPEHQSVSSSYELPTITNVNTDVVVTSLDDIHESQINADEKKYTNNEVEKENFVEKQIADIIDPVEKIRNNNHNVLKKKSKEELLPVAPNIIDIDILSNNESTLVTLSTTPIKIVQGIESELPNSLSETTTSTEVHKSSMVETIGVMIKELFSPPLLSILVSATVALVPFLRQLFYSTYDKRPILEPVGNVIRLFGNSYVPMAMVVLGSSIFGETEASGTTPILLLIIIAFIKLILIPMVNIPLIYYLHRYLGIFPDPIMRFTLMLQSGTPSTLTIIVLLIVAGSKGQGSTSRIIAIQYPIALVTLGIVSIVAAFLNGVEITQR